MKRQPLTETLDARIAELAVLIAPMSAHRALSARFDRQLFTTRSTLMGDCLREIEENGQRLKEAIARNNSEQTAWLAEHLVAQIAALTREAATGELRRFDAARPSQAKLNEKLLQHQDYERRLLAMKNTRTAQLARAETLAEQQRLIRELEVLDGRITRCRDALAKITRVVERRTR